MIITHKLTMPMDCRGPVQSIDGVQGDTVRVVEISLEEQGAAWTVPEGATAVIRYRRVKEGTGGSYDTMPDGTSAYSISDDKVTVYLVPQIFAVAEPVELQVTLLKDGAELTCFSIMVYVQGNLGDAAKDDENYVNLTEHIRESSDRAVQEAMAEGLPNALTINGQSYDGSGAVELELAKKKHSVIYVEGDSTSVGKWTGSSDDITEYFDGLIVAYKTNVAGSPGAATTLNINGLGAIVVKRNATSTVYQQYPVGTVLLLTYTTKNGVSTWQFANDFTDTKNTTSSAQQNNVKRYLIGASSQSANGVVTSSNVNCYIGADNCLYSKGARVMVEDDVTALINAALEGVATAEGVSF